MPDLPKRCVRGVLFRDYVRMVRGQKAADWGQYLRDADRTLVAAHVDLDGWYPMETFERIGEGILREVAHGQLEAVRMWGRFQVQGVVAQYPKLVSAGDPRETLMRFQTLRRSFFDYDALDVVTLGDKSADIAVAFGMGARAEEAASYQTLGFFEELATAAGGAQVCGDFRARSWAGGAGTRIELFWR